MTRYIILGHQDVKGLGIVEASSSDAALRDAVKREIITESGSYVATPERSFKAVPLTLEQTTSVKFG